jgi:uncharacterized protein (TIGR02145 family)
MSRIGLLSVIYFVIFIGATHVFGQSIKNVEASQVGDSIMVTYDLEGVKDPIIAQLYVSSDGGKTYSTEPAKSVSGDVGEVKPGTNKKLYWNVLADQDYLQGNVAFRVMAKSKYDYFTDKRDGKVYKTVTIGNQVWMAQNMNYFIDDKKSCNCYEKKDRNCDIYGRLYVFKVLKDVCPEGWHVPGKEEFETLLKNFPNAGKAYLELLSTGSSGFNSLNGGFLDDDRESGGLEDHANYWSSTAINEGTAWRLLVGGRRRSAVLDNAHQVYSYSVRCVKN